MQRQRQQFPRRRFLSGALALGAGAFLVACGNGEEREAAREPGSAAAAAPEPPAGEAAVEPGRVSVGPAANAPATLATEPRLYLRPTTVRQGSAFVVAADAPGAGFASVAFDGQVFTLLRENSRFFTILGVPALTSPGPLPLVISVTDAGGTVAVARETILNVTDANWATEVVQLDADNSGLLDPAILAEDVAVRGPVLRRVTPERHWDGLFEPPSIGIITSSFGVLRSYNSLPPTEFHSGLDFAGDNGDPVLAPNAGVIAWVGQTQRRGNGIIIDHGDGIYSCYYHLSEIFVAIAAVVQTGYFIGRIGATGLATGPHLHWEIVVHSVPVDPVQWIRELDFPNPTEEFDPADAIATAGQGFSAPG